MSELIERAHDRARILLATAELYDGVAVFMDGVIRSTYETYDSARGTPEAKALQLVHIEALRIRDDYRSLARSNREDAEMLFAMPPTPEEQHQVEREGTDA